MKCQNKNRPFPFQAGCRKRRLNLVLFFCLFYVIFVFLVFYVLVFWGYCYFTLSLPVQLIACKDRPQIDLLCVERDAKHLLTHSLILCL